MHVFFGEKDITETEIFQCIELDFFITCDFPDHLHLAVLNNRILMAFFFEAVDYPDIGIRHGVRVIVNVHLPDIGFLPVEIQLIHMILLGFDHVDRVCVDGGKSAVPVHLSNGLRMPGFRGVDNNHVVGINAPEADFVGGVTFCRPMPPVGDAVQDSFFFKIIKEFLKIFFPKTFPLFKGEFESCTLQMVQQDEEIVGVNAAMFRRTGKEIVRMLNDKLIHRAASGNQNGETLSHAPSRPSCLLPGTGDGTRITHHDTGFQITDVDSQL